LLFTNWSTVGYLISLDFWNYNDPKYSGFLENDTLSLLGKLFLTFLKNIVHLKHSNCSPNNAVSYPERIESSETML